MKICPTCQGEFENDLGFCPIDGMKLRKKIKEEPDPLIGTTLDGRWKIVKKIGVGGMGNVYEGSQTSVNRRVAIKTLRPQLTSSDEFTDRFFREAKIATKISHPHCVTVLDFGQSEAGTLYLAMEYLDGQPLTDRIIENEISFEEIYKIGIQIASALTAAHENKIVHRDLKPDNIYVLNMPNGQTFVKVLDFGIAKALDSKTQVTKAGMIFGTPEYMSPEQCRSDDVDGRSDLYGLGCILYELLGGRPPFDAKTPMAILLSHVNDEVAPIASVASAKIPTALSDIVMKLLEKNPDDRYESATVLQATLESELERFQNPEKFGSSASALFATKETVPMPAVRNEEDLVDPFSQRDTGAGLVGLIDLANTREEERIIPPKRSKMPFVLMFLFLIGGCYTVYHFVNKAQVPMDETPRVLSIEPEASVVAEDAKTAAGPIEVVEADPVKKVDKAKTKKISKKAIGAVGKKIRKKKTTLKRTKRPKQPINKTDTLGMPDPNGAPDQPKKPVSATPDPLPDSISSPVKKALKGLKIDKKIKKTLDDSLEGLMH